MKHSEPSQIKHPRKSKLTILFQLHFEIYMVSHLPFQLVTKNLRINSSPGNFLMVENGQYGTFPYYCWDCWELMLCLLSNFPILFLRARLLQPKLSTLIKLFSEIHLVSHLPFQLVTRNLRINVSPGNFLIVENGQYGTSPYCCWDCWELMFCLL